jgi:hypothetical protein
MISFTNAQLADRGAQPAGGIPLRLIAEQLKVRDIDVVDAIDRALR